MDDRQPLRAKPKRAPAPRPCLQCSAGHDAARKAGGKFLIRVEDLDQTRCRAEFVNGIFEDLRWLGLAWDEPLFRQSQRVAAYDEALDRLRADGLVYPCFCTRADIAQSVTAPHGDAALSYPGTCRDLPDDPDRRASTPHSWRLNSAKALDLLGLPSWREANGEFFTASPSDVGDAILARKDAPAAYHLACVVDDAASGVTLVVRGADLRPSTPIQRLLQGLLGLPEPTYLHHLLVTHEDGRRLAKRDKALTLAAMRDGGAEGVELARALLVDQLPSGFRLQEA